jgi:hypothetical protein
MNESDEAINDDAKESHSVFDQDNDFAPMLAAIIFFGIFLALVMKRCIRVKRRTCEYLRHAQQVPQHYITHFQEMPAHVNQRELY